MAVGASSGIGAKDACPFWYGASHGERRRKYDGDGRREQVWHEHGQNMEQNMACPYPGLDIMTLEDS